MNTSSWVRIVALVVLTLSASTLTFAQGGGGTGGGGGGTGGTPGGGTGGLPTGGTGGIPTGGTTGGNQQQTGQTAQSSGNAQPLDTSLDLGITPVEIPDARNSGFVGPTSAVVRQNGFVGASSPAMGSVPQTSNSTGLQGSGAGGTTGTAPRNTGAAAGGARTTGGAGGLAGNRNLGGGFGQGSQGTFQVTRSSLRFPLTNQINFKAATNDQVISRFQNRVSRNAALPKSGFNVSVSKGIATVTGEVDSSTAAALIESQLRLEPGIYKIDNQLKYKN